uniref:Uncharacterized protein n=1 Tax=Fusarium oxysporum (strain Fo5176) TaxID=660025 RepID=A0A0D2XS65_FUSOF
MLQCIDWFQGLYQRCSVMLVAYNILSLAYSGKSASDGAKWRPNLEAVRATVKFAMATGRLSQEGV